LDVLVPFVPLDEDPLCFVDVDFVAFGGVAAGAPGSVAGAAWSGGVSAPYPWLTWVESVVSDISVCAFFWQAEIANARRAARSTLPRMRMGFIWIHRPLVSR
jgi:hypothetical protein